MSFSIVIASYGQKEYLPEAIDSALGQTVKSEVIVVDDGSKDGSLQVAKEYGDNIKLISTTNRGLASARNTGVMNAKGTWVLPLDADDILKGNCIEKIQEVSWKHSDADVIAPSIQCFGLGDHTTIVMESPKLEDFKMGNRLAYCSAIKRSALLETGGYSPKMDILGGWEDLHLWYDLMNRGKKIVTIQEPLVYYRTKEDSMWTEAEKNKPLLWKQLIKDFPHVANHQK